MGEMAATEPAAAAELGGMAAPALAAAAELAGMAAPALAAAAELAGMAATELAAAADGGPGPPVAICQATTRASKKVSLGHAQTGFQSHCPGIWIQNGYGYCMV